MRGQENDYLWLKVTNDKYELPLVVADTLEELAMLTGAKARSISSCMARTKRTGGRCTFHKIKRSEL